MDFIVVGAGSAGSVLAHRLSRDHRVLLLEAGPADHAWDFRLHMPAALSMVLGNDRYNWYYHSEPEPGLNHRRLYCPRGRVLGGSSSINGMIYVRGHRADFDTWARKPGLEDWSFDACLPYFRRAENCRQGDEALRGRKGPVFIDRGSASHPLHQAWLEAAGQAGYPVTDDFNGASQEGAGIYDRTIRSGRRYSAARAYLHAVGESSGLTVLTHALVDRIVLEGRRAAGVVYQRKGRVFRAVAVREVILCGGAINSPQLLQLSGIGNGDVLNPLGIPVRHHLPGVGRNLQDHLEIYIQYRCRKPVSIYPALKWYRAPLIGLQWYLNGTGPGASNHFETGAFLRSGDEVCHPDLQFHFLPVAMNYDGSAKLEGHGFQVHVGPMKPSSRGSVQITSPDPRVPPRIQFNYNATRHDRAVMRRGIRLAQEIIGQAAFDPFRGAPVRPGPECRTDAEIDAFVREHAESAYHPCGTCKMGEDDGSVVDAEARVHGIDALRVIDASIMPEITNGNLNAPVIMMAEKLSASILSEPEPRRGKASAARNSGR